MTDTGWLVNKNGFEKVTVLEETTRFRKLEVKDGARAGKIITIPPAGAPNGDFHPSLYIGAELPKVWRYKGRSLRVRAPEEFADPEQAKALVPAQEPYTFLPHTAKIIDGILAGDHQLLFGGTGVGKTSLIMQIAARIGQPVIRLNFNGQVSVSDLVGSIGFGPQGTVWNDGALPRAMRQGTWLVMDEVDFAAPEVLSIFYPVLEAKPKLCLKEHDGEVVEAHPNFRVFATGNSIGGDRDGQYCGTQALNAALLNRFTGHGQAIKIEAMTARQEREVLRARLPNLPGRLVRRACDFASRLRSGDGQNPPLLATFSTRELIQFCAKVMLYRDPAQAAEITFLSIVEDKNKRQPIEEAVKLIFGKRVVIGRSRGAGETIAKRAAKRRLPSPATETPATAPANPANGRTASQVCDPAEIEAIFRAYKGNGGTLSYQQIEARFDLRPANGSTAYRIVKKADGMTTNTGTDVSASESGGGGEATASSEPVRTVP